tara:strand:+ start:1455 stop:1712 length:258 start_codon:yes stop_codon:yes gene_type:complete
MKKVEKNKNLPDVMIGDLAIILYDCWIHTFDGSQYVQEGEFAIIIERRNKLMYKPVKIITVGGKEGWVYSSNIKILAREHEEHKL